MKRSFAIAAHEKNLHFSFGKSSSADYICISGSNPKEE
jgi:hypothetical protein